jgi:pilus assembly protein CpaE
MEKPSVLIIGADADSEARIFTALRDFAKVLGAEPPSLERALESYRRFQPAVVVVSMSFDPDTAAELTQQITALGGRVVVVGPEKDPDLILTAMRSGAREYVVDRDAQDLRRAIRAQARPSEQGQGQVLSVFPAKGGVGATAVATNLAGALQRAGHRVCLLDLNLHLGDVLSFLDLPGTFSITDVIANMKRLDRDLLDTSITRHTSGVRVLAQSGKVEEAEHVKGSDISALVDFLRQHYDRVVIDGLRGFDEIALAALDASNFVLMVLTQDVPAVRNTQRCLDLFRRLGYEGDRVLLILNRYLKGSKITSEVITDALGVAPSHLLANDFAAVISAINRGNLLIESAPRSKLTRDIDELVPLIGGDRRRNRPKSGFFDTLLGRNGERADARADARAEDGKAKGNGNGSSRTPDAG